MLPSNDYQPVAKHVLHKYSNAALIVEKANISAFIYKGVYYYNNKQQIDYIKFINLNINNIAAQLTTQCSHPSMYLSIKKQRLKCTINFNLRIFK